MQVHIHCLRLNFMCNKIRDLIGGTHKMSSNSSLKSVQLKDCLPRQAILSKVDYIAWLSTTPKFTTLRVNQLKHGIDIKVLNNYLKKQMQELQLRQIPKVYFLRPDCLIVEVWPINDVLIPKEPEVIVDALCGAAVLRGSHVFAPGIMGLPANLNINEVVDVYGDLSGQCKKGLKVSYDGPKTFVGRGILMQTRQHIFDESKNASGIGVHITMPLSKLPVLNESIYPEGNVLLQNLPSIICGWVVDAKPEENILDMCAAPGNKTTHLAEMADNQANIIAIDKIESKVKKIENNCILHGITSVKCYTFDSRNSCSNSSNGSLDGPPFPENSFDKILLDAPCSGLGQRPQLKCNMTPKMLESFKFVQRKLMATAVQLLKVGGKLVYSTCTISDEENEGLVSWTLDKFPAMKLIPAEPLLGGPGWADCGLTDDQRVLVQRFGPEKDSLREVEDIYRDTIGFFIASFTKTC